jgi:nitrogen regulatory protein PII
MKEIKAFVKHHRLAAVMHALRHIEGLSGASVVEAQGFGRRTASAVRIATGERGERVV